MAGFLEQLSAVELRYEEMTHLLSQPDVAGNNQRYTALMKEYTELTPLVECWRAYRQAEATHREAKELLAQGGLKRTSGRWWRRSWKAPAPPWRRGSGS